MSDHLTDELLSRLVDGDLSLSAREAAIRHLRECARCSARQDALVSVAVTLRSFPEAALSDEQVDRIIAGLDRPAERRWPTAAMTVAAISACVAALASLAALPLTALAVTAAITRALPLQVPSSATHVLITAFIVAIAAPLAAYPLARWR